MIFLIRILLIFLYRVISGSSSGSGLAIIAYFFEINGFFDK